MEIREVQPNNYELVELVKQFKLDTDISKEEFEKFVKSLNKEHMIYILFNETNEIVGCGTLLIENKLIHNLGKVAHVEDVIISQKYRGKNLGKLLIDELKKKRQKKYYYKIILNCSKDLQKFYEKCGFVKCNEQMSIYF